MLETASIHLHTSMTACSEIYLYGVKNTDFGVQSYMLDNELPCRPMCSVNPWQLHYDSYGQMHVCECIRLLLIRNLDFSDYQYGPLTS